MKKFLTFLLLFVSVLAFSQNNGINFQGVGRNSSGAVLATQKISLRFSVIQGSETGSVEYLESKEVTTNAQGIFSVVIGDGTQISKTGNFTDINWKINPKFLKVEMDPAGGTSFAAMGTTRLQSVPFAHYANGVNADNVDGVLSASKGGTGVASISALKTALGVDQIYTTAEKNKLAAVSGTNTGDQDLSGLATISQLSGKANTVDLALKAPLESPTFTGSVSGITKAMVGLSNVENTADLAKPISSATQTALDLKASTTTLATKENAANKSTATDLGAGATSDILFPTQKAVKTYVDGLVNSGGVQDGGILTRHLADLAVTNAKVATGIDKSKVGLGNVDNTADIDKPVSTAVADALNLKASTNVANVFTERQTIHGTLGVIIPNTNNRLWYFDENEQFVFPNSTKIEAGTVTETIISAPVNHDISILTNDGNNHQFKFSQNGYLTFDDGASLGVDLNNGAFQMNYDGDIKINSSPGQSVILNDAFEFVEGDFVLKGPTNTEGVISVRNMGLQSPDFLNIKHDNYITLGNPIVSHSWWFNMQEGYLDLPNESRIESGTMTETILRMSNNTDFSIITNNSNYTNQWTFDKEGYLRFPGGDKMESDAYRFAVNTENKRFEVAISDTANQHTNYWTFENDGKLEFPDGTKFGYPEGDGTTGFSSSIDLDFLIQTSNQNEGYTWSFSKEGKLSFPDGTTLNSVAGISSGTSNFEINMTELAGFKISTNPTQLQTWEFDWEGSLIFPDGSRASNNLLNGNFGIETLDKGFSILTKDPSSNTNFEWNYSKTGSITFPDLTIASGNISNTGNFGFDTRATENGFSIITGTASSSTQVWTFDTNGVLNLPAGGDIKIGGNSVLNNSSNFMMEEFEVSTTGYENMSQSDLRVNQNNNYIWGFTLQNTPNSPNQIAFFINRQRLSKTKYSLSGNMITFDIRNWDAQPVGIYQINIDYQY